MDKDIWAAMVGFLLFFGAMFGLFAYGATLQHECRMHALEKGMPAPEIMAVCK